MLPTPQEFEEIIKAKNSMIEHWTQQRKRIVELMNKAMNGNAEITTDEIIALCSVTLMMLDNSQCPSFLSPFI